MLCIVFFVMIFVLIVGFLVVMVVLVNYQIFDEVVVFKLGFGVDVVKGNCSVCYLVDYIGMQLLMKDKKVFWQVEVIKMIKVYGVLIDDVDVGKIVDYLVMMY